MTLPAETTHGKLHVITAISNPRRFESRYRLFHDFEAYMEANPAVVLHVAEAAFGNREHRVTQCGHARHLQLRNSCEIWQKERMLQVLLRRVPKEARYIAWVDADVRFERPDWAEETMEQFQHHRVVQMFSHAVDLGPSFKAVQYHVGFGFQHKHGRRRGTEYTHWHPGFAWAARRECLEAVGGFIDTAILGAADHHMALALIGAVGDSFPAGISAAYKRPVELWAQRARHAFELNLGYVPGVLRHIWHGGKRDRQYESRWKILVEEHFDPETDIVKDLQGLWMLAGNKPRLRDRLMSYFESRNEDNNIAEPFFGR